MPAEYGKTLRRQLVNYGVKANREVLDQAARYSNQQGLTSRVMTMDHLFAPNALELTKA